MFFTPVRNCNIISDIKKCLLNVQQESGVCFWLKYKASTLTKLSLVKVLYCLLSLKPYRIIDVFSALCIGVSGPAMLISNRDDETRLSSSPALVDSGLS